MPVDHSLMKLGKRPAKHIARLPLLSRYTTALPPAPAVVDWSAKISALGMMDNDRLGDCTCAAAAHLVQAWTANSGTQFIPSDAAVLAMYEAACGYNPSDPATDQGGVESDVLTWWTKNALAGHQIDAFVALSPGDRNALMDALWLLGGAYLGIALPISAQTQDVWDVPAGGATGDGAPGSWGGHAVPIIVGDPRGFTAITWGALKRMTPAFAETYVDEAYGCVSRDWLAPSGSTPSGFRWADLLADYGALGA